MVDPNRKINHLTDDDVKYLNECENEFKDRFTENDEEFMALFNTPASEPPIVTPWMVRSGNAGPSNYRGQQQHHHQRSGNYNQRPYHHHRSHRGGRGRGGGNYNRNYRYNDNSDDNNRRGTKRPHDYNDDRSDRNDRKRDYN